MNSISVEDLLKKDNAIIIDIRGNSSYIKSHIPGAISIGEKELYFHPEKYLEVMKTYYIYCFSGHKSRFLAHYLNRLGYHTISVAGGFQHYLLIQ